MCVLRKLSLSRQEATSPALPLAEAPRMPVRREAASSFERRLMGLFRTEAPPFPWSAWRLL